jgi:hypothetical protein
MAEKNLVEEALIQIQNLEEAINENAKEILHSTMKEEISELVKESMKNEAEEEDEFEIETDVESDEDDSEEEDYESEEEDYESEEDDSEVGFDMSNLSDISGGDDFESDEVVDLSDRSLEDVLKAYKQMSPDDSFEIKKEGDFIHLKDEEDEYLIQTESEEEEMEMDGMTTMEEYSEFDESEEDEMEMDGMATMEEYSEFDESEEEETDEIVYEIEMDDKAEEEEEEEEYEFEEEVVYESKSSIKPKVGPKVKLGDAKKSIYTKTAKGGFNEKKSHVNPTKGTGKPKFEFKEGEMFEMGSRTKKLSKEEAKEASRTYGFGSKEGRGLRKGVTPNRNLTFESREITEELEMLKAKNEEYRKALNMFRDKLNEVAVFNSNLAYATRLFTEHSTSKQEKINVLRRFDSAETLKESKALYRTIKEELSGNTTKTQMTESIERVIDKSPQSGSAVNLIESKTYENPQFLRMKDIMSKIIK